MISKLKNSILKIYKVFSAFVKSHKLISGFLGALILGLAIGSIFFSQNTETTETSGIRTVETASVATLSGGSGTLSFVGTVQSKSEATIQTESSGRILYVRYELGDSVSSGAVIAEIENSSQRAALAQAEAALAQTKASINRQSGDAQEEAVNTYRSAFTSASDAVYNKTDSLFDAPRTSAPKLNITPYGEFTLQDERAHINDILRDWESSLASLGTQSNLEVRLTEAQNNLSIIKLFLDRLATVMNRQTTVSGRSQTAIDAEKASLSAGRTSVDSAIASVSSALDTLKRDTGALSGGTGEADALLQSAQANVASARAALSKTIIRAPISGTINMLELETGNFVSTNAPVVTIANNRALQIETYITAADRTFVSEGDEVVIENEYRGVVTNVAPGLDPVTKRIKVEIGVEGSPDNLVHGDTVRFTISDGIKNTSNAETVPQEIIIPITALKVETDRIVVFTVSDEGALVAHPIIEGPLVGNRIVIIEGLTPDMEIVLDARGLNEEDQVDVIGS